MNLTPMLVNADSRLNTRKLKISRRNELEFRFDACVNQLRLIADEKRRVVILEIMQRIQIRLNNLNYLLTVNRSN
jgi:hypothetical protein